ncbi:MAG: ABC transporter permease [Acidobacteria bacterium]|nr:ABC transporter permease [Acidobacteriota bacterium]
MRFLLASARKDLLHIVRDPAGLAVWIGVPLVLLALITSVFGREKITPKGKLLIADQDDSLVSRLFTSAFSQGELAKMIDTEKVDGAEGRRRMDRGDASALLIVPKGLGDAFLARKPFQLQLLKNPSQAILPEMVEEVLSVLTEGAFYLQQATGDELTLFQARPTDAAIAEASLRFRKLGDAVRSLMDPMLIDVRTKLPPQQPVKRTPLGAMMLPGMLMLAMLFTAQGMCAEIWREKMNGTLRRIAMAPEAVSQWLLGKVLAAVIMLVLLNSITLLGGAFALNASYARPIGTLCWSVFSGAMIYLAIAALQFYSSSDRASATFTNLLILPLALAGGSMAPLESLPASIARIGRMTPNGAAVDQMRHLIEGDADPWRLLTVAAALLALGAVGFALSMLALRRGFAAEH